MWQPVERQALLSWRCEVIFSSLSQESETEPKSAGSWAEKREQPEWRPSRDPPPVLHTRDEQVTLINETPKTIGKVKCHQLY
ncbi:hypothetical protein TNCV_474821 [Trichonephila clavipes]|nr:hypothetical protein TNCV_474821 [Trichonephila clavipes]